MQPHVPTAAQPIAQTTNGMRVVDVTGAEIGTVTEVRMGDPNAVTFRPVPPYFYLTNLGGLLVNGIIAARSKKRIVRLTFALGAATHVVEAGYAYNAARRAGLHDDAWKWGLQTLAVGFPSLRELNTVLRELDG